MRRPRPEMVSCVTDKKYRPFIFHNQYGINTDCILLIGPIPTPALLFLSFFSSMQFFWFVSTFICRLRSLGSFFCSIYSWSLYAILLFLGKFSWKDCSVTGRFFFSNFRNKIVEILNFFQTLTSCSGEESVNYKASLRCSLKVFLNRLIFVL